MEICISHKSIDLIMVVTDYDASEGYPAKTYGPPEDCYPGEAAYVEVNEGYLKIDGPVTESTKMIDKQLRESSRLFNYLLETHGDHIEQMMIDELNDEAESYQAEADDYAYEKQREINRGFWG